MRKKIYIERDGCNRRLLDIAKLKEYFIANNYKLVNSPKKADLILLGTCAFKKKEEDSSISRVEALKKYNHKLFIYGCLPDIAPKRFKEYSHIKNLSPKNVENIDHYFDDMKVKYMDVVDSNFASNKEDKSLRIILRKALNNIFSKDIFKWLIISGVVFLKSVFNGKKYYYLYVCRGCQGKCSYCAIKYAIGPVKSKPIKEIIDEYHRGINKGHNDFNILGDDIGCYGLDNNSTFTNLLLSLLKENIDNQQKIYFHIKELHPKWLIRYKKELLSIIESRSIKSVLCPIQSGSNRILKLMQREHASEEILDIFNSIRAINPEIELSTQIIAGFPSEADEEFEKTLLFIKEIHFDYVVVFPYHDKENTVSSRLPDKVPEEIIKKRLRKAKQFLKKAGIKVYFKCPD